MGIPSWRELQRGDMFLVHSGKLFGRLTIIRGRMRSPDGEAGYTHGGIIMDADGWTFEARRKLGDYNLYDFTGQQVLIARPDAQAWRRCAATRLVRQRYNGLSYPWWRIILHAITPALARRVKWSGVPVCTEMQADCLRGMLVRPATPWGVTPEVLEDEFKNYRCYSVIFEGRLPAKGE